MRSSCGDVRQIESRATYTYALFIVERFCRADSNSPCSINLRSIFDLYCLMLYKWKEGDNTRAQCSPATTLPGRFHLSSSRKSLLEDRAGLLLQNRFKRELRRRKKQFRQGSSLCRLDTLLLQIGLNQRSWGNRGGFALE